MIKLLRLCAARYLYNDFFFNSINKLLATSSILNGNLSMNTFSGHILSGHYCTIAAVG